MAKSKTRRFAELPNLIQQDANADITNIITQGITSSTLNVSGNVSSGDIAANSIAMSGSLGSVQNLTANDNVIAGSFVTTVIHTGVGTVTVPTSGWITGSQLSIVSNGTLTIDWGTGAKGTTLGDSAKMASGTFDGSKWFFTEASAG
tara:strand:- start:43079 stop:43519 length:441 start_codon:yes stop_codon:yes gene_type:complete